MADVIIIGAGVTGCAIARELSKTKRDIVVLEASSDICEGTSKANSGIAHAGFDAKPGTLKAKMNIRGSELMPKLAKELAFPYKQNGSLILCFEEEGRAAVQELLEKGIANGVKDLAILEKDEVQALEPAITDQVVCALYAPTGGIVCPFGLTIALAENAAENGVRFERNKRVVSIGPKEGGYLVLTEDGERYEAGIVINAAGVYADQIHNMLPEHEKLTIIPRKGEYCLYDKKAGGLVEKTIFQLPGKLGKGVLVTPTVHGNLLIGPSAEDIEDKEGVETTGEGLRSIMERAADSVKSLPPSKQIITSFAGLRAHLEKDDFMIEESKQYPGFIDVAGIESPGLTSAPAIGEYVAGIVQGIVPAGQKEDFIATRKAIPNMEEAGLEEKQAYIEQDPAYGQIICRCERITEGEILEAIRRPVGARTLDGVKRRTRAGMGRCQGGFCSPKITKLIAKELGISMEDVRKSGEASAILVGKTRR